MTSPDLFRFAAETLRQQAAPYVTQRTPEPHGQRIETKRGHVLHVEDLAPDGSDFGRLVIDGCLRFDDWTELYEALTPQRADLWADIDCAISGYAASERQSLADELAEIKRWRNAQ